MDLLCSLRSYSSFRFQDLGSSELQAFPLQKNSVHALCVFPDSQVVKMLICEIIKNTELNKFALELRGPTKLFSKSLRRDLPPISSATVAKSLNHSLLMGSTEVGHNSTEPPEPWETLQSRLYQNTGHVPACFQVLLKKCFN